MKLKSIVGVLICLLGGGAAWAATQLPTGCVPLAYIQSTGKQYIDTGVIPSANAVFEAEVEVPDAKVNADCAFFGAWCSKGQCLVGFHRKSGTTLFRRAGEIANSATPFPAAGVKAKIRVEGKTLTVSTAAGTVLSNTIETTSPVLACYQNLYLFCMNNGTDAGGPMWQSSCKMYSFRMWDGTPGALELVRDFVPCRNATGEVGLYDLVGKTFYGDKAASGSFIPGYGVTGSLPNGFRKLAYVQATGTQYVNTGLILSENASVETVVDVSDALADHTLFGAWEQGGAQFRFNVWRSGSQTVARRTGNSVNVGKFPVEGVIARVRFEGKTATVKTFDGTVLQGTVEGTASTVPCYNPMYLFALDNYSEWVPGDKLLPASAKMYSFKAWDTSVAAGGTVLLGDFVPCQAPDGEVGFYDQVGGAFHGNEATDGSKLIASPYDLPADYALLASVEATGSQCVILDPGPVLGANASVETVVQFPTRAQGDQVVFGAWAGPSGAFKHQFRLNVNRNKNGSSITFRRAAGAASLGTLPAEGLKVSLRFDGLTGTIRSCDSGEIISQATITDATGPICACSEPMRLFDLFAASMPATVRMYAFQAWDTFEAGGAPVPVYDLVPCLNADGKAGFYDRVGGRFYGNAVTGGAELRPGHLRLPEGYKVVESIEATGTQYINTLMTPTATAVLETEVTIPEEATAAEGELFGAWCVTKGQFRIGYNASKTGLFFARGESGWLDAPFLKEAQKTRFRVDGRTLTVSTAAGTVLSNTLAAAYACNQPMCLFGLNDGTKTPGGSGTPSMLGAFKMHSYKVWDRLGASDDLTMIADFAPCHNGSAYGLFDRISGQFFPNEGAGADFTGGAQRFWYDGDVLKVCDGELPAAWIDGYCTTVEKIGAGTVSVGAVARVPALTLSEGRLSLANGGLDALAVDGTFAAAGGTSIAVDLDKANGCDRIAVGSVDLSKASAANPVVIEVKKIPGTWQERYLFLSGGSLTAEDAAKFAVRGGGLALEVHDGNLCLVPNGVGFSVIIR